MSAKRFFLLVLASVTCVRTGAEPTSVREAPQVTAPHELGIGRLVPDLEITPVTGKRFHLGEFKAAPATVIAFANTS